MNLNLTFDPTLYNIIAKKAIKNLIFFVNSKVLISDLVVISFFRYSISSS